jgi:hypothetical protein
MQMSTIIDLNSIDRTGEVKQIPKPSDYHGQIYKITNKTTNKCYIGQTVSHVINRGKYVNYGYISRWRKHISDSRDPNKTKQCTALNRAIRLYGEADFTTELLDKCDHISNDLNELEISYINMYDCIAPKGYNLTEGGEKHAILDWQKKQISETLKLYYSSEETKKKHSRDHWEKDDQKRILKYSNSNVTSCNVVYKTAQKPFYLFEIFYNNTVDKNKMYKTDYVTDQELMQRVKKFLNSTMIGKPIRIYYQPLFQYLQNNN